MGFWITLFIWIAVALVSEFIRPKPKFEDARPAGLGDFSFPTATEGRPIPIIWGTVRVNAPNVTWYGSLRVVRLTEKVKTGLFSSDEVTTGYQYYVGMQMALCRGPVDKCTTVWVNEKIASGGRTGEGIMTVAVSLGGERGAGNLSGSGTFYVGNGTQTANSYLNTRVTGGVSGYRGTCYYVWEGGLVGTSANIVPWAFKLQRIPDGLNLAVEQPGDQVVNSIDANPINVIYEILTDTDWGLSRPTASIDIVSFRAAAATLASEGNGWSMLLDNAIEANELIREIQRQIDGIVYFDRSDGLYHVTLARDDYTPASLQLFNEHNILELTDYARATWEETTNQVQLLFANNLNNYKQTYAVAQDGANAEIQGEVVSADVLFPGCMNPTLANKLAWRELGTLSYPFSKLNIKVNREGFDLFPGDVFRFSWTALGIVESVFRISRIDYGTVSDGPISIFAVEDIFTDYSGVFSDPPVTGWGDPEEAPVAPISADTVLFQAPRQMIIRDPFDNGFYPRVWVGSRDPGGGTVSFYMSTRSGIAPLSGIYEADATIGVFLKAAELDVDLVAYDANGTDNRPEDSYDVVLTNNDPDDLTGISGFGNDGSVSSLRHIAYITDGTNYEFLGYEEFGLVSSKYHLKRLYRGLFHTAPRAWPANTRVWLIGQTGGNLTNLPIGSTHDLVEVKLRSASYETILDEIAVPTEGQIIEPNFHFFPLAPRDPVLQNAYADDDTTVDTQYMSETGLTGENARALKTEFTARDFRKNDVIQDPILGPDYLDDTPEFDVVLVLDPDGTPANTATITVTGTDSLAPEVYILRNAMIIALGVNVAFASDARLEVTAKHTPDEVGSEVTNSVKMTHEFTITSSLQGQDLHHGGLTVNVESAGVDYGETGTYDFDIYTALPSGGILEGRINAGSFVTIVAASNTTGSLAGVTAGDTVTLRFTQVPTNDQFFSVSGPTAEVGYGVLKT